MIMISARRTRILYTPLSLTAIVLQEGGGGYYENFMTSENVMTSDPSRILDPLECVTPVKPAPVWHNNPHRYDIITRLYV